MGISGRLVDFCHGLDYEALPPEVQKRGRYFFIDELALILRAMSLEPTRQARAFVKAVGGKGTVPVTGTRERALPQYAAFLNGMAAHSLELDDVGDDASAHPGTVMYPVLLPLSYELECGGKEFLAAVVAGYEVMAVIGKILTPAAMYRKAHHPSTLCGNFAAAMSCAKLLGLDTQKMRNALGLAGSVTCGNMQCLTEGGPGKRFQVGWASHNGYLMARLAETGFEGPKEILEGRDGIFHAYSDSPNLSLIDAPFGQPFEIMRTSVKAHASCGYCQMGMDGALALVRKHDLKPGDIEKITVAVLEPGMGLVALPKERKMRPENQLETQFSIYYAIALSVCKQRTLLDDHKFAYCDEPDMREIMGRIEVVNDPELEALYPRQWSSWVKIETKGGETYLEKVPFRKGSPENPLTDKEMEDKFTSIAGPVLKSGGAERLIDALWNLDSMKNMRNLHKLIEDSLA